MLPEENALRYVRALYPVGLLLVLVPLLDLSIRQYPPQLGTLQWRFATTGLLFGNCGTLILGMGIVGLVAALVGERGALRAVGVVALVMAVITLALLVMFAFDATQLSALVGSNFKRQVTLSSTSAGITGLLATIAWAMLGRGALTASRRSPRAATRGRAPSAPIVVGEAV